MKNFLKGAFDKVVGSVESFSDDVLYGLRLWRGNFPGFKSCPANLTDGEKVLVRGVFGEQVNAGRVRKFYEGACLAWINAAVFDRVNVAFYAERNHSPDFSKERDARKFALFMHEMTHIWQQQTDYRYTRGERNKYYYNLTENSRFEDYYDEEQACIIENYARRFLMQTPAAENRRDDGRLLRSIVEDHFPQAGQTRRAIEAKRAISAHKGQSLPAC